MLCVLQSGAWILFLALGWTAGYRSEQWLKTLGFVIVCAGLEWLEVVGAEVTIALAVMAALLQDTIQQAERGALERAWAATNESVAETARLLGVSRPTVYKLLRQHGLDL